MPAISRRAMVSDHPLVFVLQERAEVAVRRVLEHEEVEDLPGRDRWQSHQRKDVEHADGALVAVEQRAEIGLAQPAVDVRTDLDADDLGHGL